MDVVGFRIRLNTSVVKFLSHLPHIVGAKLKNTIEENLNVFSHSAKFVHKISPFLFLVTQLIFCVENTEILFKGEPRKTRMNTGFFLHFATVVVAKPFWSALHLHGLATVLGTQSCIRPGGYPPDLERKPKDESFGKSRHEAWRREWDSNPRRFYPRRFSRPVP